MQKYEVTLEIPADPHFIRIARLTAAALATELDFDVEELEDVRVAVNELCSLLIVDGGKVVVNYEVGDGRLVVSGRQVGATRPVVGECDQLVVDILEGTTDEVELPTPDDPAFRFAKAGGDPGAEGG